MQIDERDLYRYTNEWLACLLPVLNLTLGIICLLSAINHTKIW